MTIEKACLSCKKINAIEVPDDGYGRWQNGELIQRAMPEVPADQRELLISGICGPCFDRMFGGDDDE